MSRKISVRIDDETAARLDSILSKYPHYKTADVIRAALRQFRPSEGTLERATVDTGAAAWSEEDKARLSEIGRHAASVRHGRGD